MVSLAVPVPVALVVLEAMEVLLVLEALEEERVVLRGAIVENVYRG